MAGELEAGNFMQRLRAYAAERGVEVKDCGNGHIQLRGEVLVNWYPLSKRRTAYVGGMTHGVHDVAARRAVAFAAAPEQIPAVECAERRGSYKGARRKLYRRTQHCYWCKRFLAFAQTTLDHVIPLSRGGLDHENNWALACAKCNHDRGNAMPGRVEGAPGK